MENITTKELDRLIKFCQDYASFSFAVLGKNALIELKNHREANRIAHKKHTRRVVARFARSQLLKISNKEF